MQPWLLSLPPPSGTGAGGSGKGGAMDPQAGDNQSTGERRAQGACDCPCQRGVTGCGQRVPPRAVHTANCGPTEDALEQPFPLGSCPGPARPPAGRVCIPPRSSGQCEVAPLLWNPWVAPTQPHQSAPRGGVSSGAVTRISTTRNHHLKS